MVTLLSVLFMHVPQDMYLKCEDYEWLKEGMETSTLFTPSEKFAIISKWIEHTDPECFDTRDAKAD